jgi:hypothetical protein
MNMINEQKITPWYRQFWPWFVIMLPASAVVAGIATLIIAIDHPDTVVVDDYYKKGLAINQDLERDSKARSLGLAAEVTLDSTHGTVIATVSGKHLTAWPTLKLQLLHPTLARHDVKIVLQADQQGAYQGSVGELIPGNWHVIIEPPNESWRLHGRLQLPQHHRLALRAD